MSVNAQLARLAERLFSGSSCEDLIASAVVEDRTQQAAQRAREMIGSEGAALSEKIWRSMRRSLAESLAWLLLFRAPHHILQVSIDSWIDAQCEMLRRLAADRAEIETRFGAGAGQLVSLDLALSDRHSGGRAVASLAFDSGLKIVYKPRDLGIENWFTAFLASLNELGAPLPFRALHVIAGPGYGWTEFASCTRCRDESELKSFYRNAGALLCLLHLLCATDCHFENLVACGENPVFVDAETCFQPSLAAGGEAISVLRTGMLPRPALLLSPAAIPAPDLGALSSLTPQSLPVPIPGLDIAGGHLEEAVLTPGPNIPFPPGHELNPQAYVEEMIEGFCQTWRFVARHRGTILPMIASAASKSVRYVFRDTLSYYQSIVAALSMSNLDGAALPPLTGARSVFTPLEERERLALRQLDIPRFTLRADDTGLENVAKCFPLSGLELARRNLTSMSDEEMEKQAGILRVSWGFYGAAKSLAQLSNQ